MVKKMQTMRKLPVPRVDYFAGDRTRFWYVCDSRKIDELTTSGKHCNTLIVPVNCPSNANGWNAATLGSPYYPYWYNTRVLATVITVMIENRPYAALTSTTQQVLEDIEVAWRFNVYSADQPSTTDVPVNLATQDSRWKLRTYSGTKSHKLVFKWKYGMQTIYDLSKNVFLMNGSNSTVPNQASYLYLVYGNDDEHDATVQPIPEGNYQVAYLLDNFDRRNNTTAVLPNPSAMTQEDT